VKVLFSLMLSRYPKEHCFVWSFPGFARWSFWYRLYKHKVNYGALVEWYWQGGNRSTGRNICLSATLSTTSLTWTGNEPGPSRWRMEFIYIIQKNQFLPLREHNVPLEGHGLMPFREVALFTVKLIQNKYTVRQNTCFLVTAGGTYSYHCALNG
jgi:hypothetical protein